MPTVIVAGKQLGQEILEACGIPVDKVTLVTINITPDAAAEIVVTQQISKGAASKIVEAMKRYDIIKRKAPRG